MKTKYSMISSGVLNYSLFKAYIIQNKLKKHNYIKCNIMFIPVAYFIPSMWTYLQ
jgi:hypothetical protein